jgi:hypothetical protein
VNPNSVVFIVKVQEPLLLSTKVVIAVGSISWPFMKYVNEVLLVLGNPLGADKNEALNITVLEVIVEAIIALLVFKYVKVSELILVVFIMLVTF